MKQLQSIIIILSLITGSTFYAMGAMIGPQPKVYVSLTVEQFSGTNTPSVILNSFPKGLTGKTQVEKEKKRIATVSDILSLGTLDIIDPTDQNKFLLETSFNNPRGNIHKFLNVISDDATKPTQNKPWKLVVKMQNTPTVKNAYIPVGTIQEINKIRLFIDKLEQVNYYIKDQKREALPLRPTQISSKEGTENLFLIANPAWPSKPIQQALSFSNRLKELLQPEQLLPKKPLTQAQIKQKKEEKQAIETKKYTLPNKKTIELKIVEMTDLKNFDAIVNPAHRSLHGRSGISGMLFAHAGEQLLDTEIDKVSPGGVAGHVVITPIPQNTLLAQQKNTSIIHAVGPDCSIPQEAKDFQIKLNTVYHAIFSMATQHKLKTLAVPFIGAQTCPINETVQKALSAAKTYLNTANSSLQSIVFYYIDPLQAKQFQENFEKELLSQS